MEIPRPEYPRPSFVRDRWINLNGEWNFAIDCGLSGLDRGFGNSSGFDGRITVPFCVESILSGVRNLDFMDAVWYQRRVRIPAEWAHDLILFHIGAADYETELYVDGHCAGRHCGGSSSFCFDVTNLVNPGAEHNFVICVKDDLRSGYQPGGKQSLQYHSVGCSYTRTTGIWQTVWLEPVPRLGLRNCYVQPLYEQSAFLVTPLFLATERDVRFRARVKDDGRTVAEAEIPALDQRALLLNVPNARHWSPSDPKLYDLEFEILDRDRKVIDSVTSYAGMREVHIEGNKIYLNQEPLYLRFILDQGYYPEGLWTAPTDDALKRDIELAKAAGFNGARLHQKIFEERFHYWADKLGYLTWAESASWGLDLKSDIAARNFLSEWREVVMRDRNHPSIIAWTPLNETWDISDRKQHARLHLDSYWLTHSLDPTRPVNNASGGCHVKTDLYTVHIYEQDPHLLHDTLVMTDHKVYRTLGDKEAPYEGQPYIVDEFGGIKWMPSLVKMVRDSWGYGTAPRSLEEFYSRLAGQVDALLSLKHVGGYCYTQLTDVEQEQNGLYYYDRSSKFDIGKLRRIFERTPLMSG